MAPLYFVSVSFVRILASWDEAKLLFEKCLP